MPNSADTDTNSEQHSTSTRGYSGEVRWTLLDLDEIADAYWSTVAPGFRADGYDAESEKPTYEWLNENGYGKLLYTLREHHDITFDEFWTDVLDTEPQEEDGYKWDIDHEETRESLRSFVDRRQELRDSYSESTARTHRYRLARFARTYYIQHGSDDLLTPISPESETPVTEATSRVWDTFDALKRDLDDTTAYRIYSITSQWYQYLVSRGYAETDPTAGIAQEYGWDTGTPSTGDPKALDAEHVSKLAAAAEDRREELLIIGLCAWGLRIGELAALERGQFHFEDEPYIAFQERKNGPGTVNLVYGVDTAKARIADLESPTWNGYLFPSKSSESGHRDNSTLRRWFHDLADRADIPESIEGDKRKPHMGRRFWYTTYSSTMTDVLAHVSEIASEQGSASAQVVWDEYLSDEEKRSLRREFMTEKLSDVFEE
jgi:integrase